MKGKILLHQRLAGLKFRNPFIVGSGPTAKWREQVIEAEETGWGGVSIKLSMDPPPYINLNPRYRWFKQRGYHIFTSEARLNFEGGLRIVEYGRKNTKEVIIFANMAYFGDKGLAGWQNMARRFESAGAHALELNLCCPNMSFTEDLIGEKVEECPLSGASLGSDPRIVGMLVKGVVECVKIPVFAKITPEGGNIGEVAASAIDNGAAGISSVGNRTGMPPFDIYNIDKCTYHLQKGLTLGCMSGPWLKPLAQKDVFQIRKAVGPKPVVVGLGGVENYQDSIEMAMVGADLIGMCTVTMLRGFNIIQKIIKDIEEYMQEMGYNSFSKIRDKMIPYFQTAKELETLSGYAVVDEKLCTGCKQCLNIGHCHAIKMIEKKAVIDREKCLGCSTCTDICLRGAIHMNENEHSVNT